MHGVAGWMHRVADWALRSACLRTHVLTYLRTYVLAHLRTCALAYLRTYARAAQVPAALWEQIRGKQAGRQSDFQGLFARAEAAGKVGGWGRGANRSTSLQP